MPTSLPSLYKNRPVVVWVEDELTRTWLHQVWRDADIGLLVAGGSRAVHGVVGDARAAGHRNVFGFRDRDFGPSNQSDWGRPERDDAFAVFVPDAFEVENYLLDFDGLAALGPPHNPLGRSAEELRQVARRRAEDLLWWLAARATLVDVRAWATDDLPRHPKPANPPRLVSAAVALDWLERQLLVGRWGRRVLRGDGGNGVDVSWLRTRLADHEARFREWLSGEEWRWRWPGKVLLQAVRSHLQARIAVEDLARGLASFQRSRNGVEPALDMLREAVRRRAGVARRRVS